MSTPFENSSRSDGSSLSVWLTIAAAVIFCLSVVYAILGVANLYLAESSEYAPYMVFSLVPGALPFCFCKADRSKAFGVAAGLAISWMLGLEIFVGVFLF